MHRYPVYISLTGATILPYHSDSCWSPSSLPRQVEPRTCWFAMAFEFNAWYPGSTLLRFLFGGLSSNNLASDGVKLS